MRQAWIDEFNKIADDIDADIAGARGQRQALLARMQARGFAVPESWEHAFAQAAQAPAVDRNSLLPATTERLTRMRELLPLLVKQAEEAEALNAEVLARKEAEDRAASLASAREAIETGASRDAVIEKLRGLGIDPGGL